ncbi:Gfo/Idh/MocA family oxidoreductase [Luteococcus sediminum]
MQITPDRPIRWGIAGPGRMAEVFVKDFAHVEGAVVQAVGSRSQERASAFAEAHAIPTAHGSYQELCADPEVDVVYVATPHPQHRDVALMAIAQGKAVLVEKSFTATLAGSREVVEAARAAGVFCMEAMWTRLQPLTRELHRIIETGEIGTVRAVQGDLFAQRDYNPDDRLFAKELGGGALLDLGVYVLSFAQDFLGDANQMQVTGAHYPNGVESQAAIALGYESGAIASLAVSLEAAGPGRFAITGERGWIDVKPRFHHPVEAVVHVKGGEPRTVRAEAKGTGYSHEIDEVNRCLRAGLTESPVLPLDGTLAVMAQLEQALHALGVEQHEQGI